MRSGQSSSHGKNGREFDLRTINYAVRPEGTSEGRTWRGREEG